MPFLAFALIAAGATGCLKLGAQSVLIKVLWALVSTLGGLVLLLVGGIVFYAIRTMKEKRK